MGNPNSKTSGLAITALVLGLLSLFTVGLTSLPAIICGHIALSQIKKSAGVVLGKGMAIAGLIMGYLMFLIGGIVVIGMIVGVVFSGSSQLLIKQEKIRAENTAYGLKTSISAYFTDYRKYPVDSKAKENDELLSNHTIMDVLLGADSEAARDGMNPRKIVFFNGKAAKSAGNGKYRNGVLLDPGGGGELFDPWGNYYHIRLDLDYNNRIDKPKWDKSASPAVLPEAILIWSAGKDGIEGTADDIKTW